MNAGQPFEVVFDIDKYCHNRPEVLPLKPFPVDRHASDNESVVCEQLSAQVGTVLRAPQGCLAHPYIVPGGPYDHLWDTDAFLCGLGILDRHIKHYRGSLLNMLTHVRNDGRPPRIIGPEEPSYGHLPLPLHAQWCVIVSRATKNTEWVRPWWDTLKRVRQWYEQECRARRGLFRQPAWRCNSFDNDPAIYGRGEEVVAAVDVNSYHYREYQAMAVLARALGYEDEAQGYEEQASALRTAINAYMWDPIDGMYYHLDLSDFGDPMRQEITWELPYKVRSGACLWALWAGVAEPARADRMIREHVLNPDEFLSDYGIRSLAKNERMYNNLPMGCPSNFQGPIWGCVTFLTAYGLARYGYTDEALDVAGRLIAVFAGDLRVNGVLHEYYHAETGEPVFKPGVLSWSMMGRRVLDHIREGIDPAELQLRPLGQ